MKISLRILKHPVGDSIGILIKAPTRNGNLPMQTSFHINRSLSQHLHIICLLAMPIAFGMLATYFVLSLPLQCWPFEACLRASIRDCSTCLSSNKPSDSLPSRRSFFSDEMAATKSGRSFDISVLLNHTATSTFSPWVRRATGTQAWVATLIHLLSWNAG